MLSTSATHNYFHENVCAKHLGVRRLDAALACRDLSRRITDR
jgi:hypothetical protein